MKGLAREAFAAELAGGGGGTKKEDAAESGGGEEAMHGARIRKALESKDDAALCRAVRSAMAYSPAAAEPEADAEDDDSDMEFS
jgi:hypothetical protein